MGSRAVMFRRSCRNAGGDDFLGPPFAAAALVRALCCNRTWFCRPRTCWLAGRADGSMGGAGRAYVEKMTRGRGCGATVQLFLQRKFFFQKKRILVEVDETGF